MSASMFGGTAAATAAYDYYIYDLPAEPRVPREEKHEDWAPSTYEARYKDERGGWVSYTTTYFGSKGCEKPTKPLIENAEGAIWDPFPNWEPCPGESVSSLAAKLHEGSRFHFQCSPEGVKAFLKDHKRWSWRMEHITLHYSFYNSPGTALISQHGWRDLMNFIRHEFSLVKEIKVIVGVEFWEHAPWKRGNAREVIDDIGLEGLRSEQNFLWYLEKLAGRKWRRCCSHKTLENGIWWPRMVLGTNVELVFAGADCEADWKLDFVKALKDEMEKLRRSRPLMFETEYFAEWKFV